MCSSPSRPRVPRAILALTLLVLLPGAALAGNGFTRPDEPGPYAVGRVDFPLPDPSRAPRSLYVDVWYPVDPADAAGASPTAYGLLATEIVSDLAFDAPVVSNDGPFPLVIFSHGSGGLRYQSFFLTEVLASHGFVVAAPDHSGNTVLDSLGGGGDPLSAVNRPRDVSFLIDTMLARNEDPDDPFHRRIDASAIGVTGHSFGGYTTLAMASGFGDQVGPPAGVEVDLPGAPDPRVRALVPLAPASGLLSDAELAKIRVPTLILGGTLDTTTPIDPDSVRPYEEVQAHKVLRVDIEGAVHFAFADACAILDAFLSSGIPQTAIDLALSLFSDEFLVGCGPDVLDSDEVHRITNLYTVAFFQRHLNGDRRYQRFLTPGHARAFEPNVQFFNKVNGKGRR